MRRRKETETENLSLPVNGTIERQGQVNNGVNASIAERLHTTVMVLGGIDTVDAKYIDS